MDIVTFLTMNYNFSLMKYIIVTNLILCLFLNCLGSLSSSKDKDYDEEELLANQELFDPDRLPRSFDIPPHSFDSETKYRKTGLEPDFTDVIIDSVVIDSSLSVPGYRIQIFSDKTYSQAEEAYYNAIASILDELIYLEFFAPYFKIRVGDFLRREDADLHRIQNLNRLYPDAWVVPAKIYPYQVSPRVLLDDSLLYPDAIKEVRIDTTRVLEKYY